MTKSSAQVKAANMGSARCLERPAFEFPHSADRIQFLMVVGLLAGGLPQLLEPTLKSLPHGCLHVKLQH
jgi:hypothetical protein